MDHDLALLSSIAAIDRQRYVKAHVPHNFEEQFCMAHKNNKNTQIQQYLIVSDMTCTLLENSCKEDSWHTKKLTKWC